MGAYLSSPKTDKASTDEFNDLLVVGASSMQGWRNSQEDAHNSILNFDENTSLFAVYDGHGGAEVAQYCADKLPEFLKNLDDYKRGELVEALKNAFLGFDKTLLDPPVVTILKILAGEHNFVDGAGECDGEGDEEDEVEDLAELHEESHLPLNEVLEKYKGLPLTHDLAKINSDSADGKLQSPMLRGRRAAAVAAEAVNKAVMDPTAKPEGSSTSKAAAAAAAALSEVDGAGPGPSSSSSSKSAKVEQEDESTVSSSCSSSNTSKSNNPSNSVPPSSNGSSSQGPPGGQENGSVTSSETKVVEDAQDVVSGSSDIVGSEGKANGSVDSSTCSRTAKADLADISSTSKDSEKVNKKAPATAATDDDSTDDDADYDENSSVEGADISAVNGSSDEDIDMDGDDNEDLSSSDEDNNGSDDDETDEDQLANDKFCANMIEEPGKDSGCTAVVCLLNGRDLYVANAGDSRCVVSRNGRAIEMSLDHKPEDLEETTRITKAGGRVTLDGRVNGGLNLSRALGDHAYKTNLDLPAEAQMISPLPDIKKLIITPEDEFMVLACDGIWNYMTSEEVVTFVRSRLKDEDKKLSKVCEELFDNCLAPDTMGDGTGCDNMTAVIVKFLPKLQDLKASINPDETEDALLERQKKKQSVDAVVKVDKSELKRSASPDTRADCDDLAEDDSKSKSKRMKTEELVETASEASAVGVEDKEKVILKETSNESTVVVSST
ncbi:uncharacterized protein Dwil_GK10630 [Drosophila willistoni]|uniref:protein-serine/threonine phosphatase n=1 Tax=Drosophila willistoni TaxID=7260 RepID=B4MIZ4_DROWI|nr:probable protein phosphatase CG10417 [Drosophila willistoni]EDW72083.1 uncharacterized protein Dwil_GK10630 [Drosophila willistoni]